MAFGVVANIQNISYYEDLYQTGQAKFKKGTLEFLLPSIYQ